jgi:magnesium chelatase family protein
VTKYQKRISGPLLDRKVPHVLGGIDIHIEVPRVDYEKLSSDRLGESSALIRERVQAARERQRVRFEGIGYRLSRAGTGTIVPCRNRDYCNSDMRVAEVRQFCKLDETGDSLIRAATSCCA